MSSQPAHEQEGEQRSVPVNPRRKVGTEETAVGCLVREPAQGTKTEVDGGRELAEFKMRAVEKAVHVKGAGGTAGRI